MPLSIPAATAIGGMVVKDLIEDISSEIEQLTSDVSIIVDNVAEDLLGQIDVMIQDSISQIGDELNRTVDNLSEEVKKIVYTIHKAAFKLLKEIEETAGTISQEVNRDIRQTLAGISFIGEIYALDTITNTLVPYHHLGDWSIIAKGVGIGFDSEDIKSTAKMILSDGDSDKIKVEGLETADTEVEFTVPKDLIYKYRSEEKMARIKGKLVFDIFKDGFLFFNKKFRVEQPFVLSLAPLKVGYLKAKTITPEFGWVKRPELTTKSSKDLPSGHGTTSSKIIMHTTSWHMPLPGDPVKPKIGTRRFWKAEHSCSGNGCSHVVQSDTNIINNGKHIKCFFKNNSHSVHIVVKGYVERYEVISESENEIGDFDLESDSILDIELPIGFSFARITGRHKNMGIFNLKISRDAQSDSYPSPSGDSSGIEYLGNSPLDEKVIYHFRAIE